MTNPTTTLCAAPGGAARLAGVWGLVGERFKRSLSWFTRPLTPPVLKGES